MKGNLYLITNKINDKVYVGKTYHSIEERFKQHIRESRKDRSVGRDLYDAMRYFGVENFQIQLLGVFEESILEEKEMEYIKKYDSYKNGYNQTLGGDGKRYIDRTDEEIISLYKEYGTIGRVHSITKYSEKTIRKILRSHGIDTNKPIRKRIRIKCSNGMEFDSLTEASKWLINNNLTKSNEEQVKCNIRRVLNNHRKTYIKLEWSRI